MGMTKALQERILLEAGLRCPADALRRRPLRQRDRLARLGRAAVRRADRAAAGPVTVTTPEMTRFLLSLDQAVDTVFEALRTRAPGRDLHPALPAVRIDRARPGDDRRPRRSRSSYVGIRPGEKVHEVLVSEEEAPRTFARGEHLAIAPLLPGAARRRRARRRALRSGASTAPPTRSSRRSGSSSCSRAAMKVAIVLGTRPEIIRLSTVIERLDARCRARPRPHRAELRPGAQRRLLRRARRPRARPPPRDRGRGLRRPGGRDPRRQRRRCSSASAPTGCWCSATPTARCRPTSPSGWGSRSCTWRPATAASTTACPEEVNRRIIDQASDVLLPYTERSRDEPAARGLRTRAAC